MGYFLRHGEENERLRREKDISFEEVVLRIERCNPLDIVDDPNQSNTEGNVHSS
jgi:hypothetical protein